MNKYSLTIEVAANSLNEAKAQFPQHKITQATLTQGPPLSTSNTTHLHGHETFPPDVLAALLDAIDNPNRPPSIPYKSTSLLLTYSDGQTFSVVHFKPNSGTHPVGSFRRDALVRELTAIKQRTKKLYICQRCNESKPRNQVTFIQRNQIKYTFCDTCLSQLKANKNENRTSN